MVETLPQLKNLKGRFFVIALLFVSSALTNSCSDSIEVSTELRPFLTIENGQYNVDAIIQPDGISSGSAMGSGSLSFDFSGEASGRFSVTGSLVSDQSDSAGVGAFIELIEKTDFENIDEGFSLLGFQPVGNGKADIFVLGTDFVEPLDSLLAGEVYGIGPSAPFNGLFLKGLDITEFWAGQTNFIETAEQAFVLTAGFISVATRDSVHVTGAFEATTGSN